MGNDHQLFNLVLVLIGTVLIWSFLNLLMKLLTSKKRLQKKIYENTIKELEAIEQSKRQQNKSET